MVPSAVLGEDAETVYQLLYWAGMSDHYETPASGATDDEVSEALGAE